MMGPSMSRWIRLLFICGLLLSALPAAADDRKARARVRYQDGMALLHAGDFDGAVRELTAANALHRHPAIASALGQAHQARGDLVRAVAAYKAALDSPALARDERAELVEKVRALNARIAAVTVDCAVAGARVRVNGRDVGKTPLPEPVAVSPGLVDVEVSAPDHAVVVETVGVKPGFQTTVTVALPKAPNQRPAELTIDTPLPAATILVDGKRHGLTSHSKLLLLTPGKRVVALEREGYHTASETLTLQSGGKLVVALAPERDLTGGGATGTLELAVDPADARVSIDGIAVAARSLVLPLGEHEVKLDKEGFMTVVRRIDVKRDDSVTVDVALPPSADRRAAMVAEAESRQSLVFGLGAAGIALSIAGIVVTALGIGKLGDANDREEGVRQGRACQFEEPACGEAIAEAEDDQAVAAGIIAGGAIGTAIGITGFSLCVWQYVSGRDLDALDIELPAGLAIAPVWSLTPEAAYLGVTGRF